MALTDERSVVVVKSQGSVFGEAWIYVRQARQPVKQASINSNARQHASCVHSFRGWLKRVW